MAKRKKKSTVLGLDLGTHAVKAVEMSRVGEALSVTGYSYETVADVTQYDEVIKNVITTGGFKPAKEKVVVGFSGRSTLVQTVALSRDRLADLDVAMIEEAEKYIPYDISEAQIDYHVFDSQDSSQTRVLLVAVRQQDIEDKLEILFRAGITPGIIDIELVTLANAYETANAGAFFQGEGAPVAMVDFGAAKTLITVTDGDRNVFREFPLGGAALTEMVAQRLGVAMAEAETVKCAPGDQMETVKDAIYPGIEDIAGEVRSCVGSFKMAGGRVPDLTLMSGGLVAFPGVAPLFGRLTKMEARIFDGFGSVSTFDPEDELLREHAHEFAIAFGLACRARD
ncbi:MAG: pilus assembly protein PilM [Planctomycetota bacterium]|nr:pilus assembly protein PilM [Planctomycetota bacterium]